MHFFLITGPPAVGKMTVAQSLGAKTGFKLFHNHHSIELALNLFYWGEPEFKAINEGIRHLVFKTVSESDRLSGFIFTLVWGFDLEEDWNYVHTLKRNFEKNNWKFHIVELTAPQEVRLQRNLTPNRLKHKPSKQDTERTQENIIKWDIEERMNSRPGEMDEFSFLKIDNTNKSPDEVAEEIVRYFNL